MRLITILICLAPFSLLGQDLIEWELHVGHTTKIKPYPTRHSPDWSLRFDHVLEGIVLYSKQLNTLTYLSTGIGIGRINVLTSEQEVFPTVAKRDAWRAYTHEYDYLTVPIVYRHRLGGNRSGDWWMRGGIAVAWVFDYDLKTVSREPIDGTYDNSTALYSYENVSQREQLDRTSQYNLIYRLGTDYRLAIGERWQHTIGLEGRLSNFGVHDDAPGLFEHGEWSVNLTYRVGLGLK